MGECHTTPLLRSFLTPLNVTDNLSGSKAYDGTNACGSITCGYTIDNASLIGGKQLLGNGIVSLGSKNAGAVTGSFSGLYSDQQGYLINTIYNGQANIDKADLTVTATQASKIYDGTTAAAGTGSVGAIAGAAPGESVKNAGLQQYLDKSAGSGKTVRAGGVTIQDSGSADVTSNYNIRYVDNITSSIDLILMEGVVPNPAKQIALQLNNGFKVSEMFYEKPAANANAINPGLLVPAALQKSIILQIKQTTKSSDDDPPQDTGPDAEQSKDSE